MLAPVSLPPSEPVARELQTLRAEVAVLTAENERLRQRLALGDEARADLMDQAEHLRDRLTKAIRDLEWLIQQRAGSGS